MPTLSATSTLHDVPRGWWLDVFCPCEGGRLRSLAIGSVISACGATTTLEDAARRFTCIHCKQRPVRVTVGDQPANPGLGKWAPKATVRVTVLDSGPTS